MTDKAPTGTIIVSVTDAVFNERNPEHTQVAHAIDQRVIAQAWPASVDTAHHQVSPPRW